MFKLWLLTSPRMPLKRALSGRVDRLARVLRRSPAAVRGQLDRAKARLQARAVSYV